MVGLQVASHGGAPEIIPAHLIALAMSLVSHAGALPPPELELELDDASTPLEPEEEDDDELAPVSFLPLPSGTARPPLSEPPDEDEVEPSSTGVDESAHALSAAIPPETESRAKAAVVNSFERMVHP